ncbi:MAG: type III pantothenate kinase [Anaerolineae bacterium]|nr:type III pantothenate kinase [Gemmatimonadaceae bacterium]
MIIALDVGNTETTIGLFEGAELESHWRITTESTRTPDEWGLLLHALMQAAGVQSGRVSGAAIASVVPPVTGPLAEACAQWLHAAPLVIDGSSRLPITLEVDEPMTVGADRIVNTLAASRLYRTDMIVVDLGTATTYDCITAAGVFLGGVIAPGLRSLAETLFRRTSKLPAIELIPPTRVIGKRTEECIRAGVVFGAAESTDGLVRRIKKEWPSDSVPKVIATGGLAPLLAPLCNEIDQVDLYLTLQGLRLAHDILTAEGTA